MDFKETLANLLSPVTRPHERGVIEAIEAGQKAKFAEDYDQALAALDRAIETARAAGDDGAALMAELHKSEIYMRQARYAEAEQIVQRLLSGAESDGQRSYVYTMIGMIAQAQGDWVGARSGYERALDAARRAGIEGAEGRALGRLADTYLHDSNASYAAHLLREALPKLSNAGDVEPSSYITGLMGLAMIQNGQDAEGQQLIDRALRIAEQLGYRGYQRHWALLLGDRALDEGRYQDAHAYYSQVLRLFKPETNDREYVIAAARMSKASLSLRKNDEALSYAQIALKNAQALGDVGLERKAQGALGVALRSLGHSGDAIPHLQAAAAAEADAQVDVLRSLAAAQSDNGDTAAAVLTYQRAIAQAESAGTTLEAAQARRDLGLVYQRRKELQNAINEWTAALAIYDEKRAFSQVARLYCDIGSARKALGHRLRAMKDYEQALMLLNSLTENDQETRGLVLSNAANAYAEQGDAESADAFFTEAISIAEHLSDHVAETTRNGNYGWFLLLVGRPRRAIATLERALTISQQHNLTLQAGIQMDNLGLVHDALGEYPVALEKHRKALELVTEPAWAGQIKVNLANTLISTRELDEAQSLLDEALAQAREAQNGELIIAALVGQARLWVTREQAASAEDGLSEALTLARKLENRRLLAEALSVRSQQQAALGHADEASAAWEEAQRNYLILHMPQGKLQPAWLTTSPTRS
ncbi:MAG: tetratricopeptide repeat protein [Chloroflexota bacterium]